MDLPFEILVLLEVPFAVAERLMGIVAQSVDVANIVAVVFLVACVNTGEPALLGPSQY